MHKQELAEKAAAFFPVENPLYFFGPGRVNLIGEHIDYNGGMVFPAALTLGISAIVVPTTANAIMLASMNADGVIVQDLGAAIKHDVANSWGNYVLGVVAALQAEGVEIKPVNILFSSNLPDGAGLSSSAALEVLTAYIFRYLAGDMEPDRVKMAQLCQGVENQFIGVNCGIMDQFSVALGKVDKAILLNCETLEYQYADAKLGNYKLLIMNTNKRRELADSKYNERRAQCDSVLETIRAKYPIANLCEATQDQITELVADRELVQRATHVVSENLRVLAAVEALNNGNVPEFGQLLNASHQSLKDAYEVTGFHLDTIVAAAQSHSGCLGARMTGAGFGGCAIALVDTNEIDSFIASVGVAYSSATGLEATFYISELGDGVHFVA